MLSNKKMLIVDPFSSKFKSRKVSRKIVIADLILGTVTRSKIDERFSTKKDGARCGKSIEYSSVMRWNE